MDVTFNKVGLGFAEFVSKLMHETFDAILDAQNYQIDQLADMQLALQTPDEIFAKNYISEDEIQQFQISQFGVILSEKMQVDAQLLKIFQSLPLDHPETEWTKNQILTGTAYQKLRDHSVKQALQNKKEKLHAIVNRSELARIVVDSGEIKAKVELYCVNESPASDVKDVKTRSADAEKVAFEIKEIQSKDTGGIKIKELIDNQSQTRTLIIDRTSFANAEKKNMSLPTARMIASPVGSSSSLFSEVSIKFKSI